MNFRQLEYVVEVNRCGSINRAAQALFISQPALSSAIRELESELGFPVFVRSSKGIVCTAEGKRFLASAQQILRQVNEMRSGRSGAAEELPAILRVSSGRYSILSKAVIRFYQQEFEGAEKFSLYVNESGNADVVQDVFNRRADLGIIHVRNIYEDSWRKSLESRGLEHELLFTARSCVTFRSDHPLARKRDLTVEDLYDYPQIRTTSKMAEFCNYDATLPFEIYGSVEKNIFTNNRCTLYDMLDATDAVFLGIKSQYVTEFHPGLETRPLPGDDREWSVYYVKLKSTPLQPYAQRFLQILKELAQAENSNE